MTVIDNINIPSTSTSQALSIVYVRAQIIDIDNIRSELHRQLPRQFHIGNPWHNLRNSPPSLIMAPLPSLSVTYLVHVLACLGRCFHIGDGPLLRPHLALAERHLPFIVKIAFVAHQQERYALIVFHPQYLFSTKCQEREGNMSNKLSEIGLVLHDSRVCQ